MSSVPSGYVPGFICHLDTCDVKIWGFVHYQPTLLGNVLFLILFGLLLVAQIYTGWRHKTSSYCLAMITGLGSEIAGYVARVALHYDPFNRDAFLAYLICLTIGPVFIAAAIYLTLGRIVVAYGQDHSRIKPRSYTIVFMGADLISLVVQAVGGGIAASYPITNQYMIDVGTHILVAGLSFQVASLFIFSICSLEFLWRIRKLDRLDDSRFASLVASGRFKLFLVSLAFATTCLFIRTVFRSVELSGGFRGELANNEVEFMVLDGVMVILASMALTVIHPGIGFQNRWAEAQFSFKQERGVTSVPMTGVELSDVKQHDTSTDRHI